MPLYEYSCPDCEETFELLIRGGERAACPTCGSASVEKMLSVPAAHTGSAGSLPIRDLPDGGCGRPQCGLGGCQGLE